MLKLLALQTLKNASARIPEPTKTEQLKTKGARQYLSLLLT